MHALDYCLGRLFHLLDHNADSADLTLPHDKFDSTLFFEHIGEGLYRLFDTDVPDVLVFGVFEDWGELLSVITHFNDYDHQLDTNSYS